MGIIGSLAPLGGIAGPGIGGLLLAHFDWSAIFFVNVPICLLAALLGLFSLRGVSLAEQHSGSHTGLRHMGILLRRPPFRWSLLGFIGSVTIAGGLYYLLPFDLSGVQHLLPSTGGVILLCMPLGMGSVGLLGGYLTDRYGARLFTLVGSALVLAGLILLSLAISSPTPVLNLAWRLLLVGVGISIFNGPNQTLLMSVGTRESMGAASALSNLSARLGSVIGPSILSLIWFFLPGYPQQMSIGMLVLTLLGVLTVLCAWLVRPEPHDAQAEDHPVLTERKTS
jgi:MFS family permease